VSKDRIEGRDRTGDLWEATRGDALGPYAIEDGVVAMVTADRGAALVERESARLGAFLLEAAGVDLVAAARRVVESLARVREAAMSDDLEDTPHLEAQDARDEAIETLAAELAKLEAP
jgi:hypothetical protein